VTLVEHFRQYYEVRRAVNRLELKDCYKIRHRVFCKELSYFDGDADGFELEQDDFDSHSEHVLLVHKLSAKPVACVRIIHTDPTAPEKPLPYEEVFVDHLDRDNFDPDKFLPGQITEFSRLAVLPEFRNPRKRDNSLPENYDLLDSCESPMIPLALFSIITSLFFSSEADYGVAMMERSLAGLIRRSGIRCESIGERVKHCGWRSPFLFERETIIRGVNTEFSDLFREIDKTLVQTRQGFIDSQQLIYA